MGMAYHQTSKPSAFINPGNTSKTKQVSLRFGAWNTRTLNTPDGGDERCELLQKDLERYSIDICCISETKLKGKGEICKGRWKLLHSGVQLGPKTHGVGIAINGKASKSMIDVKHISERLMVATFCLAKHKLHVVSVYAPTEDKEEVIKELFYTQLQTLLDDIPKRDMLMIGGDFNAQLGGQDRSAWDGALGKFCLGSRVTDNGTRLLSFCAANQLVVRNTFFQQKRIHLATWVGPRDELANQIDHIIIRRADAKLVSNCRVMRGTMLETDHKLLRAECKLRSIRLCSAKCEGDKFTDLSQLRESETKQAFDDGVHMALQHALYDDHHQDWMAFKGTMQALKTKLLTQQKVVKHDWISAKSYKLIAQKQAAHVELMKKRAEKSGPPVSVTGKRNSAGQDPYLGPHGEKNGEIKRRTPCAPVGEKSHGAPYSRIGDPHARGLQHGPHPNCGETSHAEVQNYGQGQLPNIADVERVDSVDKARQAYRAAKNATRKSIVHDRKHYWREMAAELETHFRRGDLHKAYKAVKLRDASTARSQCMPDNMRRADGELVVGQKQNANLKKQYFSALLNVSRNVAPDLSTLASHASISGCIDDSTPSLEEVQSMIQKLKSHRAAGVDEIAAEILKWGGDSVCSWLHRIITATWESEVAPADWKKALIVPVFKSGDASVLDNYRGISLLSIPGKVYSMIIGDRMKEWADEQLLDVQSGFRPHRGCNDAIFSLRRVHEEALRQHRNVYTCFVDLSKAYDSIDRNLAWTILALRGVPDKIVNLLRDLHTDTKCAMKGDHKDKQSWFEVKTGFKQGDVNAPMLFNIFIDAVIRCLQLVLRQSGVRFVYRMDGQLRESRCRDASEIVWILMFADDIAFITESESEMQQAIEYMDQTFAQWGLELSLKKTKVMPLLSEVSHGQQLVLSRGAIDYVEHFRYLGSTCSAGLSMQPEISARIAKAGAAFHRLNKLWSDKHVSRRVRCSIYKTIVQATLVYGCETWAVPQGLLDSLDTFQMRCLRRICHISLREKRTNQSILAECQINSVSATVHYRRLRWLGHIARMENDKLPKQLLFGTMQARAIGQISTSNRRKSWADYVRDDLAKLKMPYTWYRQAQDRGKWCRKIQTILEHT